LNRKRNRFLHRVFTEKEKSYCRSPIEYAECWAVKEAVMKALGTGYRKGVIFKDIELYKEDEESKIILYNKSKEIADKQDVSNIKVDIKTLESEGIVLAEVLFINASLKLLNKVISTVKTEDILDNEYLKYFSQDETKICDNRPLRVASFLATKKAVADCLGINLEKIIIKHEQSGKPYVQLNGVQIPYDKTIHISMSNLKELSVGYAVLEEI
jgi:holo-[acyl-carrier-protein] synthase